MAKSSTSSKPDVTKPSTVHFYVLLDRSGSMSSMVNDVVGGFNAFIDEQRRQPGRAKLTLVQFDTTNPQELILDAVHLNRVPALTTATFQPRGGTPLLDATADLVGRAVGREQVRRTTGRSREEIVFVTITDGEENQSHRYTLEHVRTLIEDRTAAGWNFVFLGAGLDAYSEASRIGYQPGSVQAWNADGQGARTAFASVSRAASALRVDVTNHATFDKTDYFRGVKEAEQDKVSRT